MKSYIEKILHCIDTNNMPFNIMNLVNEEGDCPNKNCHASCECEGMTICNECFCDLMIAIEENHKKIRYITASMEITYDAKNKKIIKYVDLMCCSLCTAIIKCNDHDTKINLPSPFICIDCIGKIRKLENNKIRCKNCSEVIEICKC